jgi:hypothetical protein
MPINPTTAVTEGSAFQFQLTGPSDGSLYFAGYLTSQTSKGAFNLDLNALIATDAVTNYNTAIESFPGNVVAGFGNFVRASLWELTEPEQREPVKVSF